MKKMTIDTKKMNAIVKAIEEQINQEIEERYENDENRIKDYGVTIFADKKNGDIEIQPNNGHTFYGIDDLVLIAQFYKASYFVTIGRNGKLSFFMHSFFKKNK